MVAARASVTRDWPSERLPLNCAKRAGPHNRPGVHRWARPLSRACTALSSAARPDLLPHHPPLTPVTLPGHHSTAGTHALCFSENYPAFECLTESWSATMQAQNISEYIAYYCKHFTFKVTNWQKEAPRRCMCLC